jgi:hypothetical protein
MSESTSIGEMKSRIATSTWKLVLLAAVTGGIYGILWVDRNYKVVSEVTKKYIIDETYVIWLAVCVGLVPSFSMDPATSIVAGILAIASGVMYVVLAFKMRIALQDYCLLEHKIDLKMNSIYTFFFTIFYVNYCINDLEELEKKRKILSQ